MDWNCKISALWNENEKKGCWLLQFHSLTAATNVGFFNIKMVLHGGATTEEDLSSIYTGGRHVDIHIWSASSSAF